MPVLLFEIPLSSQSQTLQITLSNVAYQLTVQWRKSCGWVLDISSLVGVALIQGIPLVTGVDLLSQHRHLGIGGRLFVSTDGSPDSVPTYANLGTSSHLYFTASP
jgi:hypothetical protein